MSASREDMSVEQLADEATPMRAEGQTQHVDGAAPDDNPEHVPTNAWVTMGLFAVFVIAFGTCASTYMFN